MNKKIKEMRWEKFESDNENILQKATVHMPVIDGERLLVVTFCNNERSKKRIVEERKELRVVCSKKKTSFIIDKEGKVKISYLKALREMWLGYIYISEEDKRKIETFLKLTGSNYLLKELFEFIKKQWDKEEVEKKIAKGKMLDGDYALCPEELPEGLETWIRRNILVYDKILLFKKRRKVGFCYCCGSQVEKYRGAFKHGEKTVCQNCGNDVTCFSETSGVWKVDNVANITAAQKGTDGVTVFFRQWRLERDTTGEWNEIVPHLKEVARYAIRGKETAKWQKEFKETYMGFNFEYYDIENWTKWRGNRIYDSWYAFCELGAEEALQGTAMQYAPIKEYIESGGHEVVHFLEYFQKYPVVEFLWKAGYRRLVKQKIYGVQRQEVNAIRWGKDKLKDCFKFPISILKLLPPEEWTMEKILIANGAYEKNGKIEKQELLDYLKIGGYIGKVEAALKHGNIRAVVRYLEKQGGEEDFRSAVSTFGDYLRECEQLHLPLEQKRILFPPNLKEAHRRTMTQARFKNNEADQEKFEEVVLSLEKFEYASDGLIIRPAREQIELIEEGVELDHCVGGYIQMMADNRTWIFFVRKKDEPDKPFCTMEVNPKTKEVRQCRGYDNESYEKDQKVFDFVQKWFNKKMKKKEVA